MNQVFPGVFRHTGSFLTRNLVPGTRSHTEELVSVEGVEYRVWDPSHSKPAAALVKGLKHFPIAPGAKVLYLGAANGNTVSFISDIVGQDGLVYAVEISPRSLQDLRPLAAARKNIVPILANAKLPQTYSWVEKVDIIVQDVATSDQSEILIKNAAAFLKPSGWALLAIKSRSIDVTRRPAAIYREELGKLEKHFTVLQTLRLDPFEKDHLFVVLQAKV
ncbi:MAG: fibrillarin-like rRNA/tRNA 2'-O-methyltransferase [Candidatus Aenigmarchaeota archaeon]|nr:fibrillarin-like rRNA/tRNA 2'-O-methyltransferase [Candidatus Aenigmarchaeota archaeon]